MKIRGQITLENGMKAVLDYNALATFEEISDNTSASEILSADNPKFSDIRKLLFACLLRHQPDITVEEAGDLLSEYGSDVIEELYSAAIPASGESGNGKPTAKEK